MGGLFWHLPICGTAGRQNKKLCGALKLLYRLVVVFSFTVLVVFCGPNRTVLRAIGQLLVAILISELSSQKHFIISDS